MLARLQRVPIVALSLLILLLATWTVWVEYWATAAIVVVLGLTGHAIVLGAEFAVVAKVNAVDAAPRATLSETALAWWGEALTTPWVFCWQQPFRSKVWTDFLAPTPRTRGLVLVHGFICNRGIWNLWMRKLRADGIAHVAVNLEPVFGSIDDYPQAIERAVRQLKQCTGLAPVVVAHSMGGLAVRRWWIGRSVERIHHLITVGTPHQGTWLARWSRTPNTRRMRIDSPWLNELMDVDGASRRERITCFYGHCDNIVFPASTETLAGADNRHLAAVAHVRMVEHPAPYQEARRQCIEAPID